MAVSERTRSNKYRKKRIMLKKTHSKMSATFVIFMVMLVVLSLRILYINYNKGEAYSKTVLNHQSYTSTVLPYKRGQILDSNGTILAYSEKVYNLILDPVVLLSEEKYKEPTLNALVKCFGLERANLENILATKSSSQYEKLLKELTEDDIAEFKALKSDEKNGSDIKGVWFEESYLRKYPYSSLACDVIGFASAANGGEIGLEKYYNDELSGIDGATYSYVNEDIDAQTVQKEAVDGYNIVTTLDYKIQSVVENEIMEVMKDKPSTATSVMVVNPNNGEILAMANYPFFDLNNPRDISGIYAEEQIAAMTDTDKVNALYSLWSNYCVSNLYEPGSTFKSITIASALEENVVKHGDMFSCTGSISMAGYTLSCHNKSGHGELDLSGTLEQSCNPGLMQIGAKIGSAKFAKYEKLFGFGAKTGIDLPGEESGIIKNENMSAIDLACVSFGQNINLTMVQMCAAYSSIINGGNYYQPHMVKRIEKSSGEVVKTFDTTLVKQTITEETSELMRQYLRAVVEEGTGGSVQIAGYDIGGKTGSAQKQPREDRKWVISFIGAVPMDNPQYLVYVAVDEPYGTSGNAGVSSDAKDIFKGILEELLPYMGVYKDTQETEEDIMGDSQGITDGGVEVPDSEGNGGIISQPENS